MPKDGKVLKIALVNRQEAGDDIIATVGHILKSSPHQRSCGLDVGILLRGALILLQGFTSAAG